MLGANLKNRIGTGIIICCVVVVLTPFFWMNVEGTYKSEAMDLEGGKTRWRFKSGVIEEYWRGSWTKVGLYNASNTSLVWIDKTVRYDYNYPYLWIDVHKVVPSKEHKDGRLVDCRFNKVLW